MCISHLKMCNLIFSNDQCLFPVNKKFDRISLNVLVISIDGFF